MRLLVLLCLIGVAHAEPRVRPLISSPGIPAGGRIQAVGFCSNAQRAVLLLQSGDVVAVDSTGTIHPVGTAGFSNGPILCDRKNRVTVITGRQIIQLDGTASHTAPMPTSIVRHARVLDDDTIGIVDAIGTVYRYDGTSVKEQWKAKASVAQDNAELDGAGDRLLMSTANKLAIHDRSGTITTGPAALRATWLDAATILAVDGQGVVSRWTVGAPLDSVQPLHQLAPSRLFVARLVLRLAGSRLIIQRFDGPLVILDIAKPSSVQLVSRVPNNVRVAAGAAPFALLALHDRFLVTDLRTSSQAIPFTHPLAHVSSLAFSPDGRRLAMLGGDRDVLVTTLDHRHVTRLTAHQTPLFVRGPLRWLADGTLVSGFGTGQIQWRADGTQEVVPNVRALGFTPEGDPITQNRDRQIQIDRRHIQQTFSFPREFAAFEAHTSDRFLAVRGPKFMAVYDLAAPTDKPPVLRTRDRNFLRAGTLVGDGAAVMYVDDESSLFLVTRTSDTHLAKLDGFPQLVPSTDRRRVAIAINTAIQIWDDRGTRVAQLTAGGRVLAMAWSPDLRTLAVSTDAGIELWTVPR